MILSFKVHAADQELREATGVAHAIHFSDPLEENRTEFAEFEILDFRGKLFTFVVDLDTQILDSSLRLGYVTRILKGRTVKVTYVRGPAGKNLARKVQTIGR